jgi:RNA polymerase sigma-70 factor (ECF subfamily)
LRYLTRLAGAPEAEDLTQTVLLKATEGLGAFRHDSSLSTWVYRIATNVAMDRLRAAPCPPQDAPVEAHVPSAEATAIREEMNACIREFIERLPQNQRAVLVLSELEGFTNAEIAAILGVSLESVKIRLHRARARLRQAMGAGCTLSHGLADELVCDRRGQPARILFPAFRV